MAQGDPQLLNSSISGVQFLLNAETGVIIQSEDRSVESKWKEVFDASKGYTVGYVAFDWVATIDFNAIINGNTGLTLAAPGATLTLANDLGIGTGTKNGVSAGLLYCKNIKVSHSNEELRTISGTAVQRQNITT